MAHAQEWQQKSKQQTAFNPKTDVQISSAPQPSWKHQSAICRHILCRRCNISGSAGVARSRHPHPPRSSITFSQKTAQSTALHNMHRALNLQNDLFRVELQRVNVSSAKFVVRMILWQGQTMSSQMAATLMSTPVSSKTEEWRTNWV